MRWNPNSVFTRLREMHFLLQDVRYAVRSLRRNTGFTVIAVVTIGVAIGANTAVFSVVYSVMFRPLPYWEPSRLVAVWSQWGKDPGHRLTSPGTYIDWKERNNVFADMAAYEDATESPRSKFYLTGGGEPERVRGARVSINLFALLGVQPELGRTFLRGDDVPGSGPVAILSEGLWRRRFSGDPQVLGKTIRLNGTACSIVGVMPAQFQLSYPQAADLWVPVQFGAKERADRSRVSYRIVARLKPGVTIRRAQVDMADLSRSLAEEFPAENTGARALVVPIEEDIFGPTRTPFLILGAAVAFVLLLACFNIANLLLARGTDRAPEMAMRAALGASRSRLTALLLTESMLLFLLGGAFGLILAILGRGLISQIIPATMPRAADVRIDGWVAAFTFLLSAATGVLFGLIPSLRTSKPNLNAAIKIGSTGATANSQVRPLLDLLVMIEVGITLVLCIGAGLMFRSIWRLQHVELGFNPHNILTLQFTIPAYKHLEESQEAAFIARVVERIKSIPGVTSAASTTSVPLQGRDYSMKFEISGRPPLPTGERQIARWRVISPDYFRTMGMRLTKGRYFTKQDNSSAPRVVMINEAMARAYFPNEEPVGIRLRLQAGETEIVGVVNDERHESVSQPMEAAMYQPLSQTPMGPACLVVRTTFDPLNVVSAVQETIWAEDKDQPIENISTMEQIVGASMASTRFYSIVLGAFALIALILGATGVYGVVAYGVSHRTHEIGVRMAIGAEPRDIVKMITGQGMMVVLVGLIAGLAAALALARTMRSLVYGVNVRDPWTYVSVTFLLTAVALLANYVPASRASKLEAVVALRHE